jgi:hypothetical protein
LQEEVVTIKKSIDEMFAKYLDVTTTKSSFKAPVKEKTEKKRKSRPKEMPPCKNCTTTSQPYCCTSCICKLLNVFCTAECSCQIHKEKCRRPDDAELARRKVADAIAYEKDKTDKQKAIEEQLAQRKKELELYRKKNDITRFAPGKPGDKTVKVKTGKTS